MTATPRQLQAIQAKLDKWELQHLREHAAHLAEELEQARTQIEALWSQLCAEQHRADMFMDLNNELADAANARIGITRDGHMGVLTC